MTRLFPNNDHHSVIFVSGSRFITAALPSEWIRAGLYQNELKRFSQFLISFASTAKQGPDFLREVGQLLSFVGEKDEASKLIKSY